jgi:hypothetical protein
MINIKRRSIALVAFLALCLSAEAATGVQASAAASRTVTAYVAIKDPVYLPLNSFWYTVTWNYDGSRVTGESAYITTESHQSAAFGNWSVAYHGQWVSAGCVGCGSETMTGQTSFSDNTWFGNFYNTLRLAVKINGNGSWTYYVNHWLANNPPFPLYFNYSWGAWQGVPNSGPWWDRP